MLNLLLNNVSCYFILCIALSTMSFSIGPFVFDSCVISFRCSGTEFVRRMTLAENTLRQINDV